MSNITFTFHTGLKRKIFRDVCLVGSWNGWQEKSMMEHIDANGCPAFTVNESIDSNLIGTSLDWGLTGRTDEGFRGWLIPVEVQDSNDQSRHRSFVALPDTTNIDFRLSGSRYFGANQILVEGIEIARFRVWAPNAQKVEVVFGSIWNHSAPTQMLGLEPRSNPIDAGLMGGGYIADNGQGIHPAFPILPLVRESDGTWVTSPTDELPWKLLDHTLYMFRITRSDGSVRYRTYIFSRCQVGFGAFNPRGASFSGLTNTLDGSVSCSVVVDPDTVVRDFSEAVWPEQHFIGVTEFWSSEFSANRLPPRRMDDMIIYELHLGALGFGKTGPGTMQDAMDLLNYIEDLGVNTIELLPMAEFGGGGFNWGYATSHYFAIEYAGGGRDQFKHFIRECHRRGIAVIIDVVFNHYSHDAERSQWMYDSPNHEENIYYWYEGKPDDYRDFNQSVSADRQGTGGYLDNVSTGWAPRYYEESIRQMFVSSLIALVEEFHVDGFRVDQTTSIREYNVRHADGQSVYSANAFGTKLLREISHTLKMIKPDIVLIAEDHSSDLGSVVRPTSSGGMGFDGAWYANFYHSLIGDTGQLGKARVLAEMGWGDLRPIGLNPFAETLASTGHGRVVYSESHDEAGNGSGTSRTICVAVNKAHLVGSTRFYAEARMRAVSAISLFSAGTPMFLFGEEVGCANDFRYNKVLELREDLHGLRASSGSNLFNFFRDAVRLRLSRTAMKSRNLKIEHVHELNRVLAFQRWEHNEQLLVCVNLSNLAYDSPSYFIPSHSIGNGRWQEVFNSDSRFYGGSNLGNSGRVLESTQHGFACILPANSTIVFQRV